MTRIYDCQSKESKGFDEYGSSKMKNNGTIKVVIEFGIHRHPPILHSYCRENDEEKGFEIAWVLIE